MSFKFIDLFCGIGGFHIAASRFGGECVMACDIQDDACEIYEKWHGIKPEGDIHDVTEVPDHDILFAGFPCQSFSSANRYTGGLETEKGVLFRDITRILKMKQPRYFVLENVRNILRIDKGEAIKTIVKELEEAGYKVKYDTLVATNFDLPQRRHRVFFVGIRDNINQEFEFPKGEPTKKTLVDILDTDPVALAAAEATDTVKKHRRENIRKQGREPPEPIPGKPLIWDYNPAKHNLIGPDGKYVLKADGKTKEKEDYCRVNISKDSTAHTLRALCDPSAHLIDGLRRYTPREQLRLQGFPDKFEPHPKARVAQRHAGNAVAVNMVEAILENLIPKDMR